MKRRARRQREVAPERDEPTHRPPACASQADRVGRHRERGTGRLDRRNAPIRSFRPCAGSLMDPARPGEKPGIDHDGVGCWPAATPPTRDDTVTRRSRAQPPWLRALSANNHLITRAHGSLRPVPPDNSLGQDRCDLAPPIGGGKSLIRARLRHDGLLASGRARNVPARRRIPVTYAVRARGFRRTSIDGSRPSALRGLRSRLLSKTRPAVARASSVHAAADSAVVIR